MHPRLFFQEEIKPKTILSQEESRHLKALRLKANEKVELFDGEGNIHLAEIISLGKKAELKIISSKKESSKKNKLILWTAIPKGDRADWLVEKATELGIDIIQPINFRYSVVLPKKTKTDRWKRISIAACAQSKRAFLPGIDEIIKFKDLLTKIKDEQVILCHQDGKNISDLKLKDKDTILIIGPEGGFDDSELELLKKYQKLSLSDNILRTETAAIFAIGLLRNF